MINYYKKSGLRKKEKKKKKKEGFGVENEESGVAIELGSFLLLGLVKQSFRGWLLEHNNKAVEFSRRPESLNKNIENNALHYMQHQLDGLVSK